jgi:hypothetical protein
MPDWGITAEALARGCFLAAGRLWRFQSLYCGSNETITALGKGFDEARLIRFVVQGLAQFLDGRIQAMVEIHEGVFGPKPLAKLFSRHYLAGLLQQHGQNLKGLVLKLDLVAVLVKLTGAQV